MIQRAKDNNDTQNRTHHPTSVVIGQKSNSLGQLPDKAENHLPNQEDVTGVKKSSIHRSFLGKYDNKTLPLPKTSSNRAEVAANSRLATSNNGSKVSNVSTMRVGGNNGQTQHVHSSGSVDENQWRRPLIGSLRGNKTANHLQHTTSLQNIQFTGHSQSQYNPNVQHSGHTQNQNIHHSGQTQTTQYNQQSQSQKNQQSQSALKSSFTPSQSTSSASQSPRLGSSRQSHETPSSSQPVAPQPVRQPAFVPYTVQTLRNYRSDYQSTNKQQSYSNPSRSLSPSLSPPVSPPPVSPPPPLSPPVSPPPMSPPQSPRSSSDVERRDKASMDSAKLQIYKKVDFSPHIMCLKETAAQLMRAQTIEEVVVFACIARNIRKVITYPFSFMQLC